MTTRDELIDAELTNARLVVNDQKVCRTPEELAEWRAMQQRLINAAQAQALAAQARLDHVQNVLFEATLRATLKDKP